MPNQGKKIFIGHGRNAAWRELKDFIQDTLKLIPDEFNLEPVAGKTVTERLLRMLADARFALLVFTGEDEHADDTKHARENVIHEAGLFQGRLGFQKAIILLEEGCKEFSNITGLQRIPFPKDCIKATFEDIRKVLERESIVSRNPPLRNQAQPRRLSRFPSSSVRGPTLRLSRSPRTNS